MDEKEQDRQGRKAFDLEDIGAAPEGVDKVVGLDAERQLGAKLVKCLGQPRQHRLGRVLLRCGRERLKDKRKRRLSTKAMKGLRTLSSSSSSAGKDAENCAQKKTPL